MSILVSSARSALLTGLVVCALILGAWWLWSNTDTLGLVSFLARFVHVLAAIVWIGMVWFVNFVQLAAIAETDDAGRATLLKYVVPRVALTFRRASHLTLASGVVLMVSTGYVLDRLVFSSAVYIPTTKGILLWLAIVAAVVMWAGVHMIIWPGLRMLTGDVPANPQMMETARRRVRLFARLNLVLSIPVTFVMVAAAHL